MRRRRDLFKPIRRHCAILCLWHASSTYPICAAAPRRIVSVVDSASKPPSAAKHAAYHTARALNEISMPIHLPHAHITRTNNVPQPRASFTPRLPHTPVYTPPQCTHPYMCTQRTSAHAAPPVHAFSRARAHIPCPFASPVLRARRTVPHAISTHARTQPPSSLWTTPTVSPGSSNPAARTQAAPILDLNGNIRRSLKAAWASAPASSPKSTAVTLGPHWTTKTSKMAMRIRSRRCRSRDTGLDGTMRA